MKTESAVPAIVLVCSFVQIILGISFFIDYELLMQFGLTGITVTALMFVSLSFFLIAEVKAKGKYGMNVLEHGITRSSDWLFA